MNDIEKAKRFSHLFYIMRKQHLSAHEGSNQRLFRMRDMMTLGAIQAETEKSENGMIKMSDVSHIFHITPAAVTQMVREYERKGWMERVVLESDRRSVYLQLTDQASKLLKQNEAELLAGIVDFIHYLGDEDSDALLRILDKAKAYGPIMK